MRGPPTRRTVAGMNQARERLIATMPVRERRLELAGVSTAVLEGGDGPSIVLLHGPGEFAAKWLRVVPELTVTYRVVAPDLPGHGTSELSAGDRLDPERVLAWLGELIDRTCAEPPVVVGHVLGGSIAARFAARHGDRLSHLVLVDTLGLARFRPAPSFAFRLVSFTVRPNERTYERFMRRCSADLDGLRDEMGELWAPFESYNLDRARTPAVKAAVRTLMRKLGVPRIAPSELARITVPTTLIWGQQDLANPPRVAEAASARYGWPLHVIAGAADDPPRDRPQEFLEALRQALGRHEATLHES
jgi:pimeloyl-ACP methyl ester carboxylesterase